jgi:hypothetical protein
MSCSDTIRQFYRRLNHKSYGLTELAVIEPCKGIIATGFFSDEEAFVKACGVYDGKFNIYAGRNPRTKWLPKVFENYLDTVHRQRAKDSDIEHVTAISLDIDPMREKGTSSTDSQHRTAIDFALMLQKKLGGCVDDSGNGAYLWFPFETAIAVDDSDSLKQKCKLWQDEIVRSYNPERFNLRIDGCFDLSRLKKVIGTVSVKGSTHRLSRFVVMCDPNDRVRDHIMSLQPEASHKISIPGIKNSIKIPERLVNVLRTNYAVKELWLTPNGDASSHDWMLGCELLKEDFSPDEIAHTLMINPFGKFQRDRRIEYIQNTVKNLLSQ